MSGKVKYHQLTETQKKEYLTLFYDMVSGLRNRDEAKNFFKDLLTLSEVVMIARRIKIAILLIEGKNHRDIRKNLKVGYSTIANVERWLNEGFGGYKKVIENYKKNNKMKEKSKEWQKITPYSLDDIRKRYPLHFLLLNALWRKK